MFDYLMGILSVIIGLIIIVNFAGDPAIKKECYLDNKLVKVEIARQIHLLGSYTRGDYDKCILTTVGAQQ
jgi:hypothetical protein